MAYMQNKSDETSMARQSRRLAFWLDFKPSLRQTWSRLQRTLATPLEPDNKRRSKNLERSPQRNSVWYKEATWRMAVRSGRLTRELCVRPMMTFHQQLVPGGTGQKKGKVDAERPGRCPTALVIWCFQNYPLERAF